MQEKRFLSHCYKGQSGIPVYLSEFCISRLVIGIVYSHGQFLLSGQKVQVQLSDYVIISWEMETAENKHEQDIANSWLEMQMTCGYQ